MTFRNAREDERDAIYQMYLSAIGEEFCSWNEYYPGNDQIAHDFETDNLFVMTDGDALAGALSIVPENEMDDLPYWSSRGESVREIARVVVSKEFRGRGLAAEMVAAALETLKTRGCAHAHLSVYVRNIPAIKTYQKVGFSIVGEADMYGNHYLLLEKSIV